MKHLAHIITSLGFKNFPPESLEELFLLLETLIIKIDMSLLPMTI